jgi:hypothetical protein
MNALSKIPMLARGGIGAQLKMACNHYGTVSCDTCQRSGPANLNSAISGNSGLEAGLMQV